MSSEDVVQRSFEIIGEALSLEPEDFQDHETWKFLGLGDLLATAVASDLTNETGKFIDPSDFTTHQTVGAFKQFLRGGGESKPATTTNGTSKPTEPTDPWQGLPKPKVPLSVILQIKPFSQQQTSSSSPTAAAPEPRTAPSRHSPPTFAS